MFHGIIFCQAGMRKISTIANANQYAQAIHDFDAAMKDVFDYWMAVCHNLRKRRTICWKTNIIGN